MKRALAIGWLVCASAAHADVPDALDRVSFSLGGYYPAVNTAVTADSADVAGTSVDFRRDLKLDNQRAIPTGRLDFLVFDNQGFSIGGYSYSRSASTSLDREVEFDGNDFSVGADVAAHLRIKVITAEWRWWLTPTPDDVVGLGLGGVYYKIHGSIRGTLTVEGIGVSGYGKAGEDAAAPIATLGWRHAITPDFRLYADLSGVWKDGGNIRGHQVNGMLGAEYFPWRDIGFALEYDANDLTLKSDREKWSGRAHIKFYGPAAYLRARF